MKLRIEHCRDMSLILVILELLVEKLCYTTTYVSKTEDQSIIFTIGL